MLRIFSGREHHGRYLLGIERPIVRRIRLFRSNFRQDRLKFIGNIGQDHVHVGIRRCIRVKAFASCTQHVQVDHRVDFPGISERTVQEIPRSRKCLFRCAEGNEKH